MQQQSASNSSAAGTSTSPSTESDQVLLNDLDAMKRGDHGIRTRIARLYGLSESEAREAFRFARMGDRARAEKMLRDGREYLLSLCQKPGKIH